MQNSSMSFTKEVFSEQPLYATLYTQWLKGNSSKNKNKVSICTSLNSKLASEHLQLLKLKSLQKC